jgi:hypothetical protein
VTPSRRIPFSALRDSDLIIDAVYEGGTAGNQGDDPLNRLLGVGNAGGFRPIGSVVRGTVRYAALYTSGVDPDWPDTLDRRMGTFVYHGDQKTPGRELHDTPRRGNQLLRDLFKTSEGGAEARATVPPLFLFGKAAPGRSVTFQGLLIPGGPSIRPDERLVAIWKSRDGRRYQNYRATFTVLDTGSISRPWLSDVASGNPLSSNAPEAWLHWVRSGAYSPLTAQSSRSCRSREQQIPSNLEGVRMLATLTDHFRDEPTRFEACAAKLWQMMAPAAGSMVITRATMDGGRDAIGTYALGPPDDRVELQFSLEAKCYAPDNSVGVREVARLISRLRHREFGVLVTTSYLARQAYTELRDDAHPVVVICGADIVDLLRERGLGTADLVREWLQTEFG